MLHNQIFFKNLSIIFGYAKLPFSLTDVLAIRNEELGRVLSGQIELELEAIEALSLHLKMSINDLVKTAISIEALDQRFRKDELIPEKYTVSELAFARSKTVKNVTTFLNQHIEKNIGHILLHRLGVSTSLFQDPNQKIHPQLVMDSLLETRKMGVSPELLRSMGEGTELLSEAHPYGREIRKLKDVKEMICYIFDTVINDQYDNLFEYKITSVKVGMCSIAIRPKKLAHEFLRVDKIGNRELCLYKQGVALSFLNYGKIKEARLSECSCLYHGDRECIYQVYWKNENINSCEFLLQ